MRVGLAPSAMWALVLLSCACGPGSVSGPDGRTAARRGTRSEEIRNGQVELGYPAVGRLDTSIGMCTATLVSPRVVISARHCVAAAENPAGIRFSTGDQGQFLAGIGEAVFRAAGDEDFIAVRLDRAVSVPPMPYRLSPLSSSDIGSSVTLVGYGQDGPSGSFGIKRSGPSQIEGLYGDVVSVGMTGGAAACPGDSGGPVFLSGAVVGVVSGSLCQNGAAALRLHPYVDVIDAAINEPCGAAGAPCCAGLTCSAVGTSCALSGRYPGICTSGGCTVGVGEYLAEYFNNPSLTPPAVVARCEAPLNGAIDYDWGAAAPVAGLGPDGFSVRWRGKFYFLNGSHTFNATVNDGLRLFVARALVLDAWQDRPSAATVSTTWSSLGSGLKLVAAEYYERSADAVAKLSWGVASCASSPCRNGGICVDGGSSISCTCPARFYGRNCEYEDDCLPANACQHGTCLDDAGTYTCDCSPGWSGALCDTGLDGGGGWDAGQAPDAGGAADAGVDAGGTPDGGGGVDAGVDAGGTPDGGGAVDAGVDAGGMPDGGSAVDAGVPDGGDSPTAGMDATRGSVTGGCGCASGPAGAWVWSLLALLYRWQSGGERARRSRA